MDFIGFCITAIITFTITVFAFSNIIGIVAVKFKNGEFNYIFTLILWFLVIFAMYFIFYMWFNDYLKECIVISAIPLVLTLKNMDNLKTEDENNRKNKNNANNKYRSIETEYCCPECQAEIEIGIKECPNCGTEFDWSDSEEEFLDTKKLDDIQRQPEDVEEQDLYKMAVKASIISGDYFVVFQLIYLAYINTCINANKEDGINSKAIPVLALTEIFDLSKMFCEAFIEEGYDSKKIQPLIQEMVTKLYAIWKKLFPKTQDLIEKYRSFPKEMVDEEKLGISKEDFEVIEWLHKATLKFFMSLILEEQSVDVIQDNYDEILDKMPNTYTLSFYRNSKKRSQLIKDMEEELLEGNIIE